MTVGQLHNFQRSMPCKCTLATYFIHALFALTCNYIQYLHEIRLIKQRLVTKPCDPSLGNWNKNCTYGHTHFVGSRLLNDAISIALNGIGLDE
jgi:hypothetical protein